MKKNKVIISATIDEDIHEIVKLNSQKIDVSVSSIYEAGAIRLFGIKKNASGKYVQTKNAKVEKQIINF